MTVKLISITPKAEEHIMYCARVSNPLHQSSTDTKLLGYCIKHGHVSVFEQGTMTIEINTTRAISAQLLRHHSFRFQEFSQRYSDVTKLDDKPFEIPDLRLQDKKNRQSSHEMSDNFLKEHYKLRINDLYTQIACLYQEMLNDGIAKETARFILPMSSRTRIYMTGNIRDWIFYVKTRTHNSTQKEHRLIAEQIKEIFKENLPIIYEAVFS
jgi:thymidylate synthase (FAD)